MSRSVASCFLAPLIMMAASLPACSGFVTRHLTVQSRNKFKPLSFTRLLASTAKREHGFPLVIVKRSRQSRSFRDGNPLIFPGAIAFSSGEKEIGMGNLVGVAVQQIKEKRRNKSETYPHFASHPEGATQFIGWGVYNPRSMYRVRMLCHASINPSLTDQLKQCKEETEALCTILSAKLSSAVQARLALSLPSPETDTYRLVNGEGDGLSGLAIDILGGKVAVVMSSASWCEIYKDGGIQATVRDVLNRHPKYSDSEMDLVWKTTPARLKQDGYAPASEQEEEPTLNSEMVVVTTESGIRYNSLPYEKGQKTGVYCDQRENRRNLAPLCHGKRVLDLCSYHGGFSLNALIHGNAAHVTGVDSSQDAIDACSTNARLNACDAEKIDFVQSDISPFMKTARSHGKEWDVIVLDPPKLAPSTSGLDRASRKYHALNRDAIHLISAEKGGLLLTCSCSAAMTQKDGGLYFLNMVQQAAVSAGRCITLLRVNGAAPCHTQSPASYPAGAYLTAALFHVSPATE